MKYRNKKQEVQYVPLNKIVLDKEQPRQEFDPVDLASLKKSITIKGILVPLTLEKLNGNYLIVDGERRYRCAIELGLDVVPAFVDEPTSALERLIKRFHIQEQHKNWSLFDRARAIQKILDTNELKPIEISEMLGVSRHSLVNKLTTALVDKITRAVVVKNQELTDYRTAIFHGGQKIINEIIENKDYTSEQALVDSKTKGKRDYDKLVSCMSWMEAKVNNAIIQNSFKYLDQRGYLVIQRYENKIKKFLKLSNYEPEK